MTDLGKSVMHVPKCPVCKKVYSALAVYDATERLAVDVYEAPDGSLSVRESAGETERETFVGYECDECGYQPLTLHEFYEGLDPERVAKATSKLAKVGPVFGGSEPDAP